jgi:hypothetical protein
MPFSKNVVASFGPEQLTVLYRLFDHLWAELEPTTPAGLHATTRNALASALIHAAMNGERDEDMLCSRARTRARALSTLYWMVDQPPPPTGNHKLARGFKRRFGRTASRG